MAQRKKIALTYSYSENWIAGSYYVVNLIRALNQLEKSVKPHLIILHHNSTGLDLIEMIGYPFISFVNTDINNGRWIGIFLRKVLRKIVGANVFSMSELKEVEHIFEGNDEYLNIKNHYYWVHDFQELRLPNFFSKEDAEKRSALPRKVSGMKNATLILSSYDSLNDFKTFFPSYQCKVRVWRFASSLPDFSMIKFEEECQKLNIKTPYFICSNQFWQHKNHQVVLEAIDLLKKKGYLFEVVFTGKNFDHRNPLYFKTLMDFVISHQLEQWVNFVGFIDRNVQLCLAQNALSFIQPSLFEGWSTTVEDAKSLNQYILLSDIPVHREQMDYNVSFFNPLEPRELAVAMEDVLNGRIKREKRDYLQNIIAYGNDILSTFLGS
jgi:glycosyltransferase involved in cell wall biosynthesis